MVKLIGANKKKIEVGCATGYVSERLKEDGCSVIGIEIDPISSEVAKRYCDDVIVDGVEFFFSIYGETISEKFCCI